MKKKYLIILIIAVFLMTAAFSSCRQLDVVGNKSIDSFEVILNRIPDLVSEDGENAGWSLRAPDGSVRFFWNAHGAMMEIDPKPFINAGLEVSGLPDSMVNGDKIIIGKDFGNSKAGQSGQVTPLASYERIVESNRESIHYHAALDHFGISLDNGNLFEWAKDISHNDKDIVFVLDPQAFIDAGVDPEQIEGWVFAKVETMDRKGRMIEVDKLLKPFDF